MSLEGARLGPAFYSAAMSPSHLWAQDLQTRTSVQAGSEQAEMGEGVSQLPGCDWTRILLSGLMEKSWYVTSYTTCFTFYWVNTFPTIIKMPLSSGKLGMCPWGYFPMKLYGRDLGPVTWLRETRSAWPTLWNIWVGRLNLSWEGKLPNEPVWKVRDRELGLLNLSQTSTVTYWEVTRKWMSLENISRSTETDWNIHRYQHLANLVTLTRCAINTC